MIDLAFETLVPVSDAGKLNILPAKPNGKRVHKATVCRGPSTAWAASGSKPSASAVRVTRPPKPCSDSSNGSPKTGRPPPNPPPPRPRQARRPPTA